MDSDQYKIDNNSNDYWMRSFAFVSTSFKLDVENVKYVFDANTGKPLRIDNFKIKPRSDNFDFISGNSFAMQINEILKQIMDPSGIGRKVNIEFYEERFRIDQYTNIKNK